ncbi:bleomycin resistance protein [Salipiger sp. IMCC34102]|nr:bleomycin resistance protein [Salipiger sp. IMCC34102]
MLPPKQDWAGNLAALDHTVIKVPDLVEGADWYNRFLGLTVADRRGGIAYLASPVSGQIVLGLAEGGTGLDYMSFRVHEGDGLDRLAHRMKSAGVAYDDSADRTRPDTERALRLTLPEGQTKQIMQAAPRDKPSTRGLTPGALDIRTSHLQLRTPDVMGLSRFVQDALGFRVTNYVPTPDGDNHMIQFTRINDYHHQLAILAGKPGLHHVALSMDKDDFFAFLTHIEREHIPVEYGPGRHYEVRSLFAYVRDPFGNRIEVAGPMAYVGHDYTPSTVEHEHWYHMNMWGPAPPKTWFEEWT